MAEARIGSVTPLFTDVKHFTDLVRKLHDDVARGLWRTHFHLLRDPAEAQSGQEAKNLGDGLMVVFADTIYKRTCGCRIVSA
jgi:class 3 adenylate cyclase